MCSRTTCTLTDLPVELLYEVQLYALSAAFPLSSRYLYQVFHSAPLSYQAQYIKGRSKFGGDKPAQIITRALRYPLCSKQVLDLIFRDTPPSSRFALYELPRRIFRQLAPRLGDWRDRDHPLPFLRHLYSFTNPRPDPNSHDGYALTKAVQVRFFPLIRFLLNHGASPACKNGIAVRIAIQQKDITLVKMLIERGDGEIEDKGNKAKRRKLEDRVPVNREMLKIAVRCNAREIVEYLTREKGCIPDMQTLLLMQ